MVEVKVLYREGEEEQAKEILRALETIHRKRFFFGWVAYKETRGMLKNAQLSKEKPPREGASILRGGS